MTLRFGIIGTGAIAERHAAALRHLYPRAELVTCTDLSGTKALAFALANGIHSGPNFMNSDTLIESGEVDAVCICTPPPSHADISIHAARHGIHVLVEKPLATTVSDADDILAVAREAGITLSVVSQRRWLPAARTVKEAVSSGKLGSAIITADVVTENWKGPLDFGRATWRKTWRGAGGGALINQCPHSIDLLMWYMGKPVEVFGYCGNFTHPEMEMEDNVAAVIKFADGSFASLRATITANPTLRDHSLTLLGDSGARVSLDVRNFQEGSNDIWTLAEPPLQDPHLLEGYYNLHAHQLADFIDAIEQRRRPEVTGEDGRLVVAVITGIYQSGLIGKPVRIC